MMVEQNNQFKDFFDRQNSFFEEMRTQTKAYKQGFEDLRVQQHKYVDEIKASQEITHKAVLELRENQDKHGKELGRLPKDIPEWMQGIVQAGRGQFSDGISHIPRDYWPGATSKGAASASKNVEDKGKGKAEEEERGKKAWEARDKDLNE
ncbi:hypothetical protein PIB30_031270 [Stylosanthes scabra]|uniref:Uncharacterized protein n=1 Tax=Stylosanthes scabra TaxID=79078 RepID=A0ABU6X9X8_9FABA|nr:hypothetical protein [Stylosanthes scabra]